MVFLNIGNAGIANTLISSNDKDRLYTLISSIDPINGSEPNPSNASPILNVPSIDVFSIVGTVIILVPLIKIRRVRPSYVIAI